MQTVNFDLLRLNVIDITSTNRFIAVLDIMYKEQCSRNIVSQMIETQMNKLTRKCIDEMNLRVHQLYRLLEKTVIATLWST